MKNDIRDYNYKQFKEEVLLFLNKKYSGIILPDPDNQKQIQILEDTKKTIDELIEILSNNSINILEENIFNGLGTFLHRTLLKPETILQNFVIRNTNPLDDYLLLSIKNISAIKIYLYKIKIEIIKIKKEETKVFYQLKEDKELTQIINIIKNRLAYKIYNLEFRTDFNDIYEIIDSLEALKCLVVLICIAPKEQYGF